MNIIVGIHPGYSATSYADFLIQEIGKDPHTYFIHFPLATKRLNTGFNSFRGEAFHSKTI